MTASMHVVEPREVRFFDVAPLRATDDAPHLVLYFLEDAGVPDQLHYHQLCVLDVIVSVPVMNMS
jgi:hypothetical protein